MNFNPDIIIISMDPVLGTFSLFEFSCYSTWGGLVINGNTEGNSPQPPRESSSTKKGLKNSLFSNQIYQNLQKQENYCYYQINKQKP